ncbi:hypothetical protein [Pseudoroseicyclus tamaricis]|uniref:Uncharacterized protein n=1 Tax=Pseudoroseicyclus tamaricis TaxID=2705421 RepID=A0A6B2JFC5_9RHOB|nr:hypothetical protein [Pseudoroseicyclus tamaricis]NDU99720.1 hypothetical protein [Pseudoroseicyclus tamaricis]
MTTPDRARTPVIGIALGYLSACWLGAVGMIGAVFLEEGWATASVPALMGFLLFAPILCLPVAALMRWLIHLLAGPRWAYAVTGGALGLFWGFLLLPVPLAAGFGLWGALCGLVDRWVEGRFRTR